MPFGVLCHEFGHQLGFPDLYNTSGVSYPSNIGLWDVMDYGSWANNGKSPTHPSAWSKQLVGWVTPVQLSSSSAISLRNYENYSDTYRIPILGSSTEYFLVEFRKQTRSDAYIPGNGVLIYHIDDTIGSLSANNINSISPHLRVSCVEADKNGDIPTNHGDSGDAFIDGSIFTMPQSNAYLSQSYISISNIVGYTTNLITMSYSNPRIPSVSGLSPSSGTSINPTTISITGSGFFGGVGSNTVTAVRLDNGTAITSYIVATDSLIRAAVVPSGVTAGTYNVLVYTQSGNNTTSAQTFVVQGLTGTPAKPTCTGSFTLTISWAAGTAADPISGIAGYYLQVGTSLGGADRFDGYVGNILKYNITGCSSGKTYYARVKAKNNVGVFTVYSVNSDAYSVNVVSTSKLYGNLLNPLYSPPASIQYTIGTDSVVKITVHKSNGEIIRTILNSAKNAGTYTDAVWDGKDEFGKVVASGVYYVFIDAGSYREQKKVLIVK